MKKLRSSAIAVVILVSASILTGCTLMTMTYGTTGLISHYENPQWAPPYYDGARYYYLPDAECYYDLSTREFIFLNNGQWRYSSTLPSIYADINLDNCFTIVLNVNVYKPWMHHQYYASHYPRYYYRDYYDHSNIPYVRGFNENSRSAVYWKESERSRARSWDNANSKNERQFKYTKEDRQQQKSMDQKDNGNQKITYSRIQDSNQNTNSRGSNQNQKTTTTKTNSRTSQQQKTTTRQGTTTQQEGSTPQTGQNQSTNYYGKTIGNPVKVKKQMQKEETKTKSTSKKK